tara:strand:- start:860 stop:1087 length:228 start_codon:yes stop_codon:yes gene_type:complete
MINKKYSQPLFMIIMSFGMSVIIGAVVTVVHTGTSAGFLDRFLDALIFSFPVAIIAAFTMAPLVRSLLNKIASKE